MKATTSLVFALIARLASVSTAKTFLAQVERQLVVENTTAVANTTTKKTEKATPASKVVDMLVDMQKKGEAAMKLEAATYAEYKAWEHEQQRELGFEVDTHNSNIEKLGADIAKYESDVAQLTSSIEALQGEVASLEADKAGASKMRDVEHAEYVKLSTDLAESVDALERAIAELKAQDYDRPQAEAFLQNMAKKTKGMRRVLAALVQQGTLRGAEEDEVQGAPEVAGYSFQSTGIIETLEKLLEKFKSSLADVEQTEANQAHQYSMTELHLSKNVEVSNRDLDARTAAKGRQAAAGLEAQGELTSTQNDLVAAEQLSKDIAATFQAKTTTFEMNQNVRKQELETIAKAIEILSSDTVAGSYAEHVKAAPVSLLQQGSANRNAVRQRAVQLLRNKGLQLSSQELKKMASQVAENPLAKVIAMIEDLLVKLQEEAAAEAQHKQWCDQELERNKATRTEKTSEVGELSAEIAEYNATISTMAQDLATLDVESSELARAMEEATLQREKEKTANLNTIADADAGATAVKQAVVILHEFYSKQAALLQKSNQKRAGKQVPELEEYKGMQESTTGVIGMLEVIETDFARLSSETRSAEDQAAAEYKKFMSDSTTEMKRKHDVSFQMTLAKDQAEFEKEQTEKERAAVQKELDAANSYYQALEPACVTIHVSYEERQAKRQEEIEALKQTYAILDQKSSD